MLKNLTRQYRLESKIEFLGYKQKEEIYHYFANSDIFVSTSHSDPFSIVASESIASGLFSIISKYDLASEDLIKNGINGFIINPFQLEEVSNKIDEAISMVKSHKIDKEKISASILQYNSHYYANKLLEAICLTRFQANEPEGERQI